ANWSCPCPHLPRQRAFRRSWSQYGRGRPGRRGASCLPSLQFVQRPEHRIAGLALPRAVPVGCAEPVVGAVHAVLEAVAVHLARARREEPVLDAVKDQRKVAGELLVCVAVVRVATRLLHGGVFVDKPVVRLDRCRAATELAARRERVHRKLEPLAEIGTGLGIPDLLVLVALSAFVVIHRDRAIVAAVDTVDAAPERHATAAW